jgi:hypothetical protein
MRTRWIIGLITGAIALGIVFAIIMHRTPTNDAATLPVRLGQAFELSLDQTATVESENLELRLIGINDSRCPSDVQCAWAGEVTTTVTVTKGGIPIGTVELTQQPGASSAVMQAVDGYSLELMDVLPHPKTEGFDPMTYHATLRLTESDG